MFAYKFSMNTAGERSLSLHPAVSLSKPEWTTAGKTKRGCSGTHIEAGDRLDDFRTRETARAVGASIAFLFFFPRIHPTLTRALAWKSLRRAASVKSASPENQPEHFGITPLLGLSWDIKYVDYYLFFNYHWLSLRSIFHTARELLSDVGTGVSEFVIICT